MQFTESKQLGSYRYDVTKLLARDAIRLGTRVGALIAPFAGKLAGAADLEAAIGEAVGDLFARPDLSTTLEYCCEVLGNATQVHWTDAEGEKSKTLNSAFLDSHFRDRLDEWAEWLVFALKVNLSSFFSGASGLGAKLRAAAKKAEATRATSETPSGSLKQSERTG